VVAVIVALGFAVWREIASSPGHCVQRSLSAYYYTPVRPMFVGAMLIIGFAMIVMWGKTSVEDAALNLAGLLLMVVALVPTLDANYCSVTGAGHVQDPEAKEAADDALIKANAETVSRSFTALLFVVTLVLILIAVAGVLGLARPSRQLSDRAVLAYVITWLLAGVAVVIYFVLYQDADKTGSAFNHHVHSWSANIAVCLIIVAVVSAAVQKKRSDDPDRTWWVWFYGIVAALMAVAIVILKGGDRLDLFSGWLDDHATFVLEAILIALLGVFWSLQTIDRRNDGAPTY
jgi:cytochrome bd-type quinol oxidase subunit 2